MRYKDTERYLEGERRTKRYREALRKRDQEVEEVRW